MDNHYHLLLEAPSANLSRIMAHINSAYTSKKPLNGLRWILFQDISAGRRISGQLKKDKSLAKTIKKIEDNLSIMKV